MKKTILHASVLAAFAAFAGAAVAQTAAAPAATPEHSVTGNLTVATDYRFRGISQTYKQPTVQGGFDYSHSSGFYLGNWNSNVSGNSFPGGASLEMDFYGGYKWEVAKGVTADVGALYYYYPGAEIGATGKKFNNGEVYLGATWEWLTVKLNYAVTDFFGLSDATAAGYYFSPLTPNGSSKGSTYLDITGNWEVAPKTTLTAHVGRQNVKGYGAASYTDYKLGIARDFGFATVGLALIGTNASDNLYQISPAGGQGGSKELGKSTVVLSASKTF